MSNKYELVYRSTKGSPVTPDEVDGNFRKIKTGHDTTQNLITNLENKTNGQKNQISGLAVQLSQFEGRVSTLRVDVDKLIDEGLGNITVKVDLENYYNKSEVDQLISERDAQNLQLNGTLLSISNGNSVDLSSIDTDSQTLTLTGNTLQISGGNSVDLSSIDTDSQTLTLTGNTLQISGGNSVDLSGTGGGLNPDNYYTKTEVDGLIPTPFSGDYNDLTNKPTIPVVPTNVSAFTNDSGYLTAHQDLSLYALKTEIPTATIENHELRISKLEGKTIRSVYEITAPDNIIAGSTGTDDDVVIVSSNSLPNSIFRLVVKYELSTGIVTTILDDSTRQMDYALENKYDLNIPWNKEFNGAKINSVIIEVYDDPNSSDPRTEALVTKTISVLPAAESFTIGNTSAFDLEEGETVTITINTSNIFNDSELQYTIGGIQETDTSTPLSGTLTLSNVDANNGTGSVQFDIVTLADDTTEGDETVSVSIEYGTQQEEISFQLLDVSRATETITIENWIDEVIINQGGNTIPDKQVLLDVYNTFRTDLLALTSPSDLNMTMTEVYLLLIKKSWIDNATTVLFPTNDGAWLTSANTIITAYNSDIQSAGVTNEVFNSDPMMPRPSDGTREDDVAYSFVYNNPTVNLTLQTVLYTGTEEKPI
jgi:hypothetical protein